MTIDEIIELEHQMSDLDYIESLCDCDEFKKAINSGKFMEAIEDRSISLKTIEEIVNKKI